MAELSVVFEKKGSYSYKPDMFYVCFDKLYWWRVQTKYFFQFEKLHVVLRLSLIYIPLSKYFYEERKVKKIKTFDLGFAMYLPFARGLLILVIVLGQEVFARPATGKFRFISK